MIKSICLVEELHKLFLRHDVNVASRWEAIFSRHRDITMHPHQQMHTINTFWRLQIGLLKDVDTFVCRQAIVDGIDTSVWLHNYEKYIIPVIVKHQLPNMEPYYGHTA